MGCQPVSSDFRGPLPKDTVGLVLGRSSSALKGLIVHPGVINSAYTGEVKILCSSPRGITSISPGDCIAQLLVLPSCHSPFPSRPKERSDGGLGSTGIPSLFVSLDLRERPQHTLIIQGKQFKGILDTGADTSIISSSYWPKNWPVNKSSTTLQGLGYESQPNVSAQRLKWQDDEGNTGEFIPYVLPLPVNLWGRDVLQSMSLKLTNEYSPQSKSMMQTMGYVPGRGLGKKLQGQPEPIQAMPKTNREGLGFS